MLLVSGLNNFSWLRKGSGGIHTGNIGYSVSKVFHDEIRNSLVVYSMDLLQIVELWVLVKGCE